LRKIIKGDVPVAMKRWKRANPQGSYSDIDEDVRKDIRTACVQEQFGLCAYCCKPITAKNSHNEHVESQKNAPKRTMDFENIVASCNTRGQCGDSHESVELPLTPLMDECETEMSFLYSGRVKGLSERAKDSINILNLGNRKLKEARKQAIEALQYEYCCPPEEAAALDAELIEILMKELSPDGSDTMKPYAPVLMNILKHELEGMRRACS